MPDYVKGQEPYSRQGLLNSVEHSLKLLNTKKIDVLLIHDPYVDELQQAMAPGGMMEGMRELQQQGVVAQALAPTTGISRPTISRTTGRSRTAIP